MSSSPFAALKSPSAALSRSDAVRVLDDALVILRERRGLDFAEYRRGTLERRLANRMVAARVESPEKYLAVLRDEESGEVDRLAANLTIKVSRFYRNAGVFDLLSGSVLPSLRDRFPALPLRVWSAGCAAGEEAYTLATLLGPDDAAVIATDVDELALGMARRGTYGAESLVEMPASRASEMFEPEDENGSFRVVDSLRKRVVFERHDLAAAQSSPAGGPFHLVSCRNVLIYFARPLQDRAMKLLVDSVMPGGVLVLGEAEWPGASLGSLDVLDRRAKIFRRRPAEEVGR
jgi:two-component system, chemotaxis family, CheB/CheR fusion protein